MNPTKPTQQYPETQENGRVSTQGVVLQNSSPKKPAFTPGFWIALVVLFLSLLGTYLSWFILQRSGNPVFDILLGVLFSFGLFWIMYSIGNSRSDAEINLRRIEQILFRQEKRFNILSRLRLDSTKGIQSVLKTALDGGISMLGLDIGMVAKIEKNSVTVLEFSSSNLHVTRQELENVGKSCYSISFYANEVVGIDRMGASVFQDHPCFKLFRMNTYLGIPLIVDGEKFGTLMFFGKDAKSLRPADRDFVSILALFIEIAFEKQVWLEKIKASSDELMWVNKIKIGRELRMIELKKEVFELKKKLESSKKSGE